MKKTCLYVLMISALLALVALWVATIRGMISEDVSAAEQVAEAVKTTLESKKQESTEAESCRQVTEAIETKVSTENATEETTTEASYIEPKTTESGCYEESTKMVFISERKTAERTAVTTEEIYGEINEDGYGWVQLQYSAPYNICENHLTHDNGSINVYGHHETWYSTQDADLLVKRPQVRQRRLISQGSMWPMMEQSGTRTDISVWPALITTSTPS